MSNKTVQEKVDSAAQALFDLSEKLKNKNAAVVTVVEPSVNFDALDLAVREIRALVDGEETETDTPVLVSEEVTETVSDTVTTEETAPVVEEVAETVTEEVTEQTDSVSIS